MKLKFMWRRTMKGKSTKIANTGGGAKVAAKTGN
jgi:hypothetical protein